MSRRQVSSLPIPTICLCHLLSYRRIASTDLIMPTAELPRLLAVFLVIFDDLQGGKVAFEVPEGSVGGSNNGTGTAPSSAHEIAPLPPGSSLLASTAHSQKTAAAAAGGSNSAANTANELFELQSVLQYILPRKPVVRHLVTICVDQCKILGFPVWIEDRRYPRGHFICKSTELAGP